MSFIHAKAQFSENSVETGWAALRVAHREVKNCKILVKLYVEGTLGYFGGPDGGEPTWRLDTPLCAREMRTWLVETT